MCLSAVSVCVCVCPRLCVFVYVCVYVYLFVYVYMCVYVYVYVYICSDRILTFGIRSICSPAKVGIGYSRIQGYLLVKIAL